MTRKFTTPTLKEGDTLTDASGTVWLVESFWIDDEPDEESIPGYFSITLVEAAFADDMEAMSYALDPHEFDEFCKEHGITL